MYGVWGYWVLMPSFNDLLSQGATHAWLYIPVAILLGALHGLEPGHSKTMMAAFIVAVRGTIPQAVLLGVSAAFSHSLIIWLLAAVALRFGSNWNAETTEPYFQLASGVIIVGLAVWMFFRTRREDRAAADHHHSGDGPHGGQIINTGQGLWQEHLTSWPRNRQARSQAWRKRGMFEFSPCDFLKSEIRKLS